MSGKRQPDIKIPSEAKLAYMAGIVDGEGNIRISHAFSKVSSLSTSYSAQITVTNTDINLIVWLLDTFGGNAWEKLRANSKSHWKEAWDWKVFGNNAAVLAEALLPYLIVKREQAQLLLNLRDLRATKSRRSERNSDEYNEEALQLQEKIVALNARGVGSAKNVAVNE